MTSRVVTVRADEPVSTAVDRMTRFGFSALPVVTGSSRVVGMVSLLDVLRFREVHGPDGADDRTPVEEIMSPDVLSMSATANAAAVADRLRSHGQLRVLPVVQGGRLVGVVTRSDLLRDRAGSRPARRRLFGGGRDRLKDRAEDRAEDDALAAMVRVRRTGPAPSADTPVSAVMTREVVVVAAPEPVAVAARLMLDHRHTALPVVEGEWRLVGIISEADILADPLAGRKAHSTVASVMTRTPVTIGASATVGQARALVADHGLRTVPVVDGGTLVGVVSRSDLV